MQRTRDLESPRNRAYSEVKKVRFFPKLLAVPVNKEVRVPSSSMTTSSLRVEKVPQIRLLPTPGDSESDWPELKCMVTRIPFAVGEGYVVTEVERKVRGFMSLDVT